MIFFSSYFQLFSTGKEQSSEKYHDANRPSCTWTFILAFPNSSEPDFANSTFFYCMLPKPSLVPQCTNVLGASPCKILKLFLNKRLFFFFFFWLVLCSGEERSCGESLKQRSKKLSSRIGSAIDFLSDLGHSLSLLSFPFIILRLGLAQGPLQGSFVELDSLFFVEGQILRWNVLWKCEVLYNSMLQ